MLNLLALPDCEQSSWNRNSPAVRPSVVHVAIISGSCVDFFHIQEAQGPWRSALCVCGTSVIGSYNFTPYHPMTSRFRDTVHFETSVPTPPPKWPWTMQVKYTTYIMCHYYPESQISFLFTQRSAPFELQAILRNVVWMTLMTLKLTGSNVSHICYSYPCSPNCTPFHYMTYRSRDRGNFETGTPNYPPNDIEPYNT